MSKKSHPLWTPMERRNQTAKHHGTQVAPYLFTIPMAHYNHYNIYNSSCTHSAGHMAHVYSTIVTYLGKWWRGEMLILKHGVYRHGVIHHRGYTYIYTSYPSTCCNWPWNVVIGFVSHPKNFHPLVNHQFAKWLGKWGFPGFLKWRYPWIIKMIFHHKPSILGYPYFRKPPSEYICNLPLGGLE